MWPAGDGAADRRAAAPTAGSGWSRPRSPRWFATERRTFRADRVAEARPTGETVRIDDPPDAAGLVATMLTSHYPVYGTVVLPVPLPEARRLVPPGAGVHESVGADATRVTVGGRDLDELATRLLALAVPLTGVEPGELRAVLRARLRSQLDALGPEDA
ncbi:WYL domain-containing protein [Streptomyces tremellae]|uniref:WYL domain-containing protein n=1 Tax=Streptomyces tremellae TaxID=1124239 RepID=A0ABP7EUZ7_9ACTN